MITLEDVTITLTGKTIIDRVSLQVHPGEFICLLGNNGAGKSTLVKAVTGELPINDGKVSINGIDIRNIPLPELATLRAVMPQSVELNFRMRAGNVVRLGRHPYGRFDEKDELYSQHSMSLCHMEHLQEDDYTQLSGGEKQRTQLARVLNQTLSEDTAQRYLIVDECTSNLDLAHQHHIFKQLKRKAQNEGLGVLAVVHDINLATCYADRIGFLSAGKLISLGKVEQVVSQDMLYRVYGIKCLVTSHPLQGHPVVLASC